MGYRRGNAVLYAAAYWDKVCDDGYIAMRGQPAYIKHSAGAPWPKGIAGDFDCAHFVSRCLARLGGGLQIPNNDGLALGILSVPALVKFLQNGIARTIVEAANADVASKHLSGLEPGDVIAYHAEDFSMGHSALYLGNELISCHTINRWGKKFTDPSGLYYTFLHIAG